MGWTTPRTWVAGELLTAALLNTHLRDNDAAIRAGGIAIASQAALDLITGGSATGLARTAAGTALQYPRLNAAGTAWEFAGTPMLSYAATLANCQNSVAETDIFSFTIPANLWVDGDIVDVTMSVLVKNNKGTGGAFNPKLYVGGVGVALSAGAPQDSTVENSGRVAFRLQRYGATVAIPLDGTYGISGYSLLGGAMPFHVAGYEATTRLWTPTFTNAIVVKYSLTLSEAHTTFYAKPQVVKAVHFKG